MSNIPGRPGVPSGTVIPPSRKKKMSGADRKRLKDEAVKLVEKIAQGSEWMILGFRIDPNSGAVQMTYKLAEYPGDLFEETATLFAEFLTKLAGENPDVIRQMTAQAQQAQAQAQAAETSSQKAETSSQKSETETAVDQMVSEGGQASDQS